MKKILLCVCLFSSTAYANQCEIIDTELAASYSEMKTYGSYNENNEEKYQSSEKRFKEALAKIENLEGKFCASDSDLGLAIWRHNARIWQHLALSVT